MSTYYVVDTSGPLHRIVRADGSPLCRPPEPDPSVWTPASSWLDVPHWAPGETPPTGQGLPPRAPRRPKRPQQRPLVDEATVPTGAQLAAWRREAGLSQRDFAAKVGLSRSVIAEVETGRRFGVGTRLRLAAWLGQAVEGTERVTA